MNLQVDIAQIGKLNPRSSEKQMIGNLRLLLQSDRLRYHPIRKNPQTEAEKQPTQPVKTTFGARQPSQV